MESNKIIHKHSWSSKGNIADERFHEEIIKYMESSFPGREKSVYHELISDIIHVDINILKPTIKEKYYVVFTTGMSDLDMTVPKPILEHNKNINKAELFMLLPGDWKFESENWLMSILQYLARFPHAYDTFLSDGHTVPNTRKYTKYTKNSKLSCAILLPSPFENVHEVKIDKNTSVYMYFVFLLTKKETRYNLKYGVKSLMTLMENSKINTVLDYKRRSMV